MSNENTSEHKLPTGEADGNPSPQGPRRGHRRFPFLVIGVFFALILVCGAWIVSRGLIIKDSLEEVRGSVPKIQALITTASVPQRAEALKALTTSVERAHDAAKDPLWKLASLVPWLGDHTSATTEAVASVRDVVIDAIVPLASDPVLVNLAALQFGDGAIDTKQIKLGAPRLRAAADVVELSHQRVAKINKDVLVSSLSIPLSDAEGELSSASSALNLAADVATVMPSMLGSESPRQYLVLIQNSAESRATGGIPGALAVLTANDGQLALEAQASASSLGVATPSIKVEKQQEEIYSSRLGKFIQDVNLTPHYPTAADTALRMWKQKTGQTLSGVISVDPVALSYLLKATGPVKIEKPDLVALAGENLPTSLSADNVVHTLLSDVYSRIEQPSLQDAYFAGVAQEVFSVVAKGLGRDRGILDGLVRGAAEGRILIWSSVPDEQDIIGGYPLSGSVLGPSVPPAQFGVYFNDGTGAKMDYYVKRTVKLIKECPRDGYEQTTVRITSTNTAPDDAATSLPRYVTGGGNFGVPPGTVQTNIVAYGPVQAHVETAKIDGQKTEFAPYFHSSRPVGILATRLAPGESRTVEFTFGKIVQHTEPNVVVTPTVQDVKDVTLATEMAACS